MIRSAFTCLILLAVPLGAAEPPPAVASLTYSGDQAALAALDREVATAGKDAAKLAVLEARLLAVLRRSDTTFAARQAVCQRLGAVLALSAPKSGADAFKPLDTMLLDERDSDLARLALDPAPGAAVDGLLVGALGQATGRARLGLIDSIARRRIDQAVPALTSLVAGDDAAAAAAAARALGEIGTAEAEVSLRTARKVPPVIVAQARLQASARLPAADALRVLHELRNDSALPAAVRAAAFRRSLDADPRAATAGIIDTLGGADWTLKQVALESLAGALSPELLRALIAGLASWDAPTQAAVIAALGHSGDAVAVPPVSTATRHAEAEVRAAALTALGLLPGNRDVVSLLAKVAAGDDPADAKAARESLARLNGSEVPAAILAGAERADAGLRTVFLEQLALRNMTEALPLLRQCRQESDASVRAAAVGALGDLASFSEQPAVLDWTLAATDDAEQSRALRALVNVTLRSQAIAARGRAVYAAIERAKPDDAIRLIPALARIGGEASADCASRLALRDDAKVAEAAAAALGRWSDASALPALAAVAGHAAIATIRTSALADAIRYLERNRDAWTPAITTAVSRLLASAQDPVPRKQLVALLARANDTAALKLATDLQSDARLADDARYAASAIKAAQAGPPKVRAAPPASAANMLDGKTSTRWSAPLAGEEWIEIDFRQSRLLRRITLDQTGRAAEFPEQYEVHVTDNPKSPGPALVTGQGQRNKTVIEFPAGTKGRYVVIQNTAERKDTPWAICELFVD